MLAVHVFHLLLHLADAALGHTGYLEEWQHNSQHKTEQHAQYQRPDDYSEYHDEAKVLKLWLQAVNENIIISYSSCLAVVQKCSIFALELIQSKGT